MVEIGKEFGGRDHSTVVYAIQQIEEKSARDPVTKATVSDIIKNIRDRWSSSTPKVLHFPYSFLYTGIQANSLYF